MRRISQHATKRRLYIGGSSAAVVAIVALLGIAAASAYAAPQHWYSVYEGPAEEHNSELTASVEEPVSGKAQSTFDLGWNIGGVEFTVSCTGLSTGGSITNPAGGGAGELTGAPFALDGCSVSAPSGQGCVVPATLKFATLTAVGVVQGSASAIKFVPQSGENLIVLSVSGCTAPGLNGNKPLEGQITAVESAGESRYSFTGSSGSKLTYGGQPAFIDGAFSLENEAAAAVTLPISGGVPRWHLVTFTHEIVDTKLTEGTPTSFGSASGSTSLSLSSVVGGIDITVSCGGAGLSGVIENPAGGGAGTASGALALSSCTLQPESQHCSVSVAEPAELLGTVTEIGGEPGVSWESVGEVPIVNFNVSECSKRALDGQKPLEGKLLMTSTAKPGSFAFSGTELRYGGQAASASGQTTLQNSASERLTLAP